MVIAALLREALPSLLRSLKPDFERKGVAHMALFGSRAFLRYFDDDVDAGVLWSVYRHDLAPLDPAIDAMLAASAPKDGTS